MKADSEAPRISLIKQIMTRELVVPVMIEVILKISIAAASKFLRLYLSTAMPAYIPTKAEI